MKKLNGPVQLIPMPSALLLLLPLMAICSVLGADADQGAEPEANVRKDVITLRPGEAIIVKESTQRGRSVIVGYIDGDLQTLQLEDGGKTPVGVRYISEVSAEISVTREDPKMVVIDKQGDGIPDIKIDDSGVYKLKTIEWTKVSSPKGASSEQNGPAKPSAR